MIFNTLQGALKYDANSKKITTGNGIGIFGKSLSVIRRDLSNGAGIGNSLFNFGSVTKDDIANIKAFNEQRSDGIPIGQAWKATMVSSTTAGKQAAVAIKNGATTLGDLETKLGTSRLAMIGMKAATIALNAALSIGLSIAIQGLISGLDYLIHYQEKQAEAAKEQAEKSKEAADKADEEAKSLSDLINKYQELAKSDKRDVDTINQLKDIQSQITDSVGAQADNLDLVNGKLDDELDKLKKISREKAKKDLSTYRVNRQKKKKRKHLNKTTLLYCKFLDKR